MHCCMNSKALKKMIIGESDPIVSLMLSTSIFGVTNELIIEYENELLSHENYYPWMVVAMDANRLRFLDTHVSSCTFTALSALHNHYLSCAFLSGQRYFSCAEEPLSQGDETIFDAYGIRIYTLENYIQKFGTVARGDNPLEEITLTESSNYSPAIVTQFLKQARNLIIYDKYVNANAIEFIKECCSELPNGSIITILTKYQKDCFTPSQIMTMLSVLYPGLTINSYNVIRQSNPLPHDRYLFVDNRYQIDFSAGLDSFIKESTGWTNKRSKVSVYDILTSTTTLSFNISSSSILHTNCYDNHIV